MSRSTTTRCSGVWTRSASDGTAAASGRTEESLQPPHALADRALRARSRCWSATPGSPRADAAATRERHRTARGGSPREGRPRAGSPTGRPRAHARHDDVGGHEEQPARLVLARWRTPRTGRAPWTTARRGRRRAPGRSRRSPLRPRRPTGPGRGAGSPRPARRGRGTPPRSRGPSSDGPTTSTGAPATGASSPVKARTWLRAATAARRSSSTAARASAGARSGPPRTSREPVRSARSQSTRAVTVPPYARRAETCGLSGSRRSPARLRRGRGSRGPRAHRRPPGPVDEEGERQHASLAVRHGAGERGDARQRARLGAHDAGAGLGRPDGEAVDEGAVEAGDGQPGDAPAESSVAAGGTATESSRREGGRRGPVGAGEPAGVDSTTPR